MSRHKQGNTTFVVTRWMRKHEWVADRIREGQAEVAYSWSTGNGDLSRSIRLMVRKEVFGQSVYFVPMVDERAPDGAQLQHLLGPSPYESAEHVYWEVRDQHNKSVGLEFPSLDAAVATGILLFSGGDT